MRTNLSKPLHCHKQQGVVLVISLLLLLPITIMAVTMLSLSVQGERMTANHKNQTQAFLAAEAGLQRATQVLYEDWDDSGCNESLSLNDQHGTETTFSVYVTYCDKDDGTAWLQSTGLHENSSASRTIEGSFLPPTGSFTGGPAPISCFGTGSCMIEPPKANNAQISGYQHPLPPDNCSGKNNCTTQPTSSENAAPAIFIENLTLPNGNQNIVNSAPGNKSPYCGASSGDDDAGLNNCQNGGGEITDDESMNMVWHAGTEGKFLDENGEPDPPTASDYFDNPALFPEPTDDDDRFDIGTRDEPKITYYDESETGGLSGNDNNAGVLIVDGEDFDRQGTGVFVGVIMVKNCGTVNLNGNFTIYGSVIVDTTGCGCVEADASNNGGQGNKGKGNKKGNSSDCEYNPFGAGGTPSVRYSDEGMGVAENLFASGKRIWREVIREEN